MTDERVERKAPSRRGRIPRGPRVLLGVMVIALVVASLNWLSGRSVNSWTDPVVGSDLHALGVSGGRIFLSGHKGGVLKAAGSRWRDIRTLRSQEVVAWATVPGKVLAGGHDGLLESRDGGMSFMPSTSVPPLDVHGLGASGDTVYVSSVQHGVLRSQDGGATFVRRHTSPMIMGPISVDDYNGERAVAVDVRIGVIRTADGGSTWTPVPGASRAISVAWNPRDRRELTVVTGDSAMITRNWGRRWTRIQVPIGSTAVTYTANGRLLLAALTDGTASTYQFGREGWQRLR